ncbi:hypothetical protein BT69DRAFT_1299731 [Atractiella rhizophila]|nr:hypothetical protein BT69DRAFT_1299731 [Atractiella rhizophila]
MEDDQPYSPSYSPGGGADRSPSPLAPPAPALEQTEEEEDREDVISLGASPPPLPQSEPDLPSRKNSFLDNVPPVQSGPNSPEMQMTQQSGQKRDLPRGMKTVPARPGMRTSMGEESRTVDLTLPPKPSLLILKDELKPVTSLPPPPHHLPPPPSQHPHQLHSNSSSSPNVQHQSNTAAAIASLRANIVQLQDANKALKTALEGMEQRENDELERLKREVGELRRENEHLGDVLVKEDVEGLKRTLEKEKEIRKRMEGALKDGRSMIRELDAGMEEATLLLIQQKEEIETLERRLETQEERERKLERELEREKKEHRKRESTPPRRERGLDRERERESHARKSTWRERSRSPIRETERMRSRSPVPRERVRSRSPFRERRRSRSPPREREREREGRRGRDDRSRSQAREREKRRESERISGRRDETNGRPHLSRDDGRDRDRDRDTERRREREREEKERSRSRTRRLEDSDSVDRRVLKRSAPDEGMDERAERKRYREDSHQSRHSHRDRDRSPSFDLDLDHIAEEDSRSRRERSYDVERRMDGGRENDRSPRQLVKDEYDDGGRDVRTTQEEVEDSHGSNVVKEEYEERPRLPSTEPEPEQESKSKSATSLLDRISDDPHPPRRTSASFHDEASKSSRNGRRLSSGGGSGQVVMSIRGRGKGEDVGKPARKRSRSREEERGMARRRR